MYARACLAPDRIVHVCDSFQGFPKNEPETHWKEISILAVSQTDVMKNFQMFRLLEGVNFVAGNFEDTLPKWTGEIAVLRIDCDSMKSNREVLWNLYPKVSPGGFVICDDSRVIPCLEGAYSFYLGYEPKWNVIDESGAWFQKPHSGEPKR